MEKFKHFISFILLMCSLSAYAEDGVYVHPSEPPDEMDMKVIELYSSEFELINFSKDESEYFGSEITYGFQPNPLYTPAKDALVEAEGLVYVFYVVDSKGIIKTPKAHVIEGCPCLAVYLEHQITMFKFKPATLNGKAVSTVAMTPFEFKPNKKRQQTR